jgi:hypothetical protein
MTASIQLYEGFFQALANRVTVVLQNHLIPALFYVIWITNPHPLIRYLLQSSSVAVGSADRLTVVLQNHLIPALFYILWITNPHPLIRYLLQSSSVAVGSADRLVVVLQNHIFPACATKIFSPLLRITFYYNPAVRSLPEGQSDVLSCVVLQKCIFPALFHAIRNTHYAPRTTRLPPPWRSCYLLDMRLLRCYDVS